MEGGGVLDHGVGVTLVEIEAGEYLSSSETWSEWAATGAATCAAAASAAAACWVNLAYLNDVLPDAI